MPRSRWASLGVCLAAVSGPAAGQWTEVEEAKLVASDAAAGDQLGTSVAVEGDTLVVGAPGADVSGIADVGAAYVYVKGGSGWSEIQKLTPAVPSAGDAFGTSVTIDAGRILIGAPLRDVAGEAGAGAVEAFVWNGAGWVLAQELTAPIPRVSQRFGTALALDGDTALVGAPSKSTGGGVLPDGEVSVLVETSGSWTHQAKLTSKGTFLSDQGFGAAVALDGDLAAVGAPFAWGWTSVFRRAAGAWTWEDIIYPRLSSPYSPMQYGMSVAVEGDSILAGAPNDRVIWWTATAFSIVDAGAAQLHEPKGSKWAYSAGFVRPVPLHGEEYGDAVALDGNLALFGAPGGDHGQLYLWARSGQTWKQVAKINASDGESDARFGDAVALEGTRAVAGAPLHGAGDQGAVYVYALSAPAPASYCTAGTSASGCAAVIATAGQASASAPSGFTVSAARVEGSRPSVLIYGTAGKQALPWGSGTSYLCIVPPLSRSAVLPGTGTPGSCDGAFAVDLNALWCPGCPKAGTNPGESAAVQAQFWYRDPLSTSGDPTALSDAVQFWLGP